MGRQHFKFEKDTDSRWYVVLPEWRGDRSELEMVCGADTMLDIFAQGEVNAWVRIKLECFDGFKYELTFTHLEDGGAWYDLSGDFDLAFPVWLCHVTEFVFGHLPKKLYIG